MWEINGFDGLCNRRGTVAWVVELLMHIQSQRLIVPSEKTAVVVAVVVGVAFGESVVGTEGRVDGESDSNHHNRRCEEGNRRTVGRGSMKKEGTESMGQSRALR